MAHTYTMGGKTVTVFPCERANAPVIYLNTFGDEGARVLVRLQTLGPVPCSLVAISQLDWNRDMAPWDAPSAFRGGDACTGGADTYLELLTGTILPTAERELNGAPCWRGLAGYSLAGLFALYALYRTDCFARAASMSGSLWFPGFRDYALSRPFCRRPDCVYFSLGRRESKTRNPLLQTVGENTEALYRHFRALGIPSVFRYHPGNHYGHAVERTANGIAWLLNPDATEDAPAL